jgi:hypothetical protein
MVDWQLAHNIFSMFYYLSRKLLQCALAFTAALLPLLGMAQSAADGKTAAVSVERKIIGPAAQGQVARSSDPLLHQRSLKTVFFKHRTLEVVFWMVVTLVFFTKIKKCNCYLLKELFS